MSSRVSDDPWFQVEELDPAGRAVVAAGWLSYLPQTPFDLYSAIIRLHACGERATARTVCRLLLDAGAWGTSAAVGDVDFDVPLGPEHGGSDPEDVAWDQERWSVLRAEARRHGLAVATPHEVLGLLCELRLIQRDGTDAWSPIMPVPLLEDVVEVPPEERAALANMRAHVDHVTEKRLLREWLRDRTEATDGSVAISISSLAEALRLRPAKVRAALALLIEEGVIDGAPLDGVHGSQGETREFQGGSPEAAAQRGRRVAARQLSASRGGRDARPRRLRCR